MSGVLAATSSPKPAGIIAGGGEWSIVEQLVLVEAVQQYGSGLLPDFTSVGKAVRMAMMYAGNAKQRDQEFYAPHDVKNRAAGRVPKKDSTPADRAAEMVEKIRDDRKAEIKVLLAKIVLEAAQMDKDMALINTADAAMLERFVSDSERHPDLELLKQPEIKPQVVKKESKDSNVKVEGGSSAEETKPGGAARPPEAPGTPATPIPAVVAPSAAPTSANISVATPNIAPATTAAAVAAPTPPAAVVVPPSPSPMPVREERAATLDRSAERRVSKNEKPDKPEKHESSPPQPQSGGNRRAPVSAPTPSTPAVSVQEQDDEVMQEDLPIAILKKRNEAMMRVWKAVMSHEKAEPFKKPVTKREAPDYHNVIKKPMALNDVKKKLDKGEYEGSPKDFMADMQLIFSNAMTYNLKGSDIWSWAKELQAILRKEEISHLGDTSLPDPQSNARNRTAPGRHKESTASTPMEEEEDASDPRKAQRVRAKKGDEDDDEDDSRQARSRRGSGVGAPRDSRKRRRDD